jgi:hypothetical protein
MSGWITPCNFMVGFVCAYPLSTQKKQSQNYSVTQKQDSCFWFLLIDSNSDVVYSIVYVEIERCQVSWNMYLVPDTFILTILSHKISHSSMHF